MANKIEQLDNTEVVDLFIKNGYGEYEEVLRNNGITGKNLFTLQEFEVMRWKLPIVQKRRLWSCLTELKKNPETFQEPKPEKKHTINKKQTMLNKNSQIKEKLELVIGGGKTFENKPFEKSEVKISSSTPPIEGYRLMDKRAQNDGEFHDDSNGYLPPIRKPQEVEENDYEPPPAPKKITGFVPTRYSDIKKSIGQRPPKALPKNDSRDYISKNPKITNIIERRETPKVYPEVQISHKSIPNRRPSPKISKLPNTGDKDVEETYESAPHVTSSTYANKNQSLETQENETLTKKPKGLLWNTFEKKSPNKNHEKKWHNLNINSSRNKSKNYVKSLEKEVPLQNRPLPPLPRENSPTKDRPLLKAVYLDDLENKLSAQFAQQNKMQAYTMTDNNHAKEKLPTPPNALFPIPLKTHILSNNSQDEELREYNNAIFNINDEPYYRDTDRKGAKLLLRDLEDGAFLFRPSRHFFLTLSLKYCGKYLNLGVEKTESNKIRLHAIGDTMSPEFATLRDLIANFTRESITFLHEGSIVEARLKKVLPF